MDRGWMTWRRTFPITSYFRIRKLDQWPWSSDWRGRRRFQQIGSVIVYARHIIPDQWWRLTKNRLRRGHFGTFHNNNNNNSRWISRTFTGQCYVTVGIAKYVQKESQYIPSSSTSRSWIYVTDSSSLSVVTHPEWLNHQNSHPYNLRNVPTDNNKHWQGGLLLDGGVLQ